MHNYNNAYTNIFIYLCVRVILITKLGEIFTW